MTQTPLPTTDTFTASWRGINHLALVTADMDATVRFYHGTLGARLVTTIATATSATTSSSSARNAPWPSSNTPTPPIEPFTKPAGLPDPRAAQFDHLALNLPDEAALHELQRRLKTSDCEVTASSTTAPSAPSTSPTPTASPSRPPGGSTTQPADPADYNDNRQFADPEPVPLSSTPDHGHAHRYSTRQARTNPVTGLAPASNPP